MTARGYTGEAVTGGKMAIRRLDVAWILMIVMISFTVAAGDCINMTYPVFELERVGFNYPYGEPLLQT